MKKKTVNTEGLDRLIQDFDKIKDEIVPALSQAAETSLLLVEGSLKEYPPQPSRIRSAHFNTYVRGVGSYPRSAFTKKSGKLSTKRAEKATKRGKVRMTSQKLGAHWKHKIETNEQGVVGYIGNEVTYASFVQGDSQTGFHAETGWLTDDEAIEDETGHITDHFNDAIDKLLSVLDQGKANG